jgi:hypothetical protein
MSPELQAKLYADYPKIFRQKDLPKTQTCMCWGIECGDGWYGILDRLCYWLQSMHDNNPEHKQYQQVEASQVKEKFGTLRFYTNGCSETQDGGIDFAEHMSAITCEICGKPGTLNDIGWIACRCAEHK